MAGLERNQQDRTVDVIIPAIRVSVDVDQRHAQVVLAPAKEPTQLVDQFLANVGFVHLDNITVREVMSA